MPTILQNRYRLIQLLSQGVFGKTFIAIDEEESPDTLCIIKQLTVQNQSALSSKNAADLGKQKAIRLQELGQHPQIPALLDFFEEDQQFYWVQGFIEGTNLAKMVQEEGTFSEDQIWQLLEDLLPVIKFIHDHQVIHRDIKPENIIRRSLSTVSAVEGQYVLVDFSTAKLVTEIDPIAVETRIGSAEYVAPEQAKGKAVFASDLYSLGVTCIYLLTGVSPFDLFDVANNGWVWQQYMREKVSDRLTHILDKLLQNAVNRRFQSADEVLQAIAMGNGEKMPTPSPVKPEKWQCLRTLTGHRGLFASVTSIAISQNPVSQERILASGSEDKTIRLWNLETGEAIATLTGHSHFVTSVAFSPDGKILATGSDDQTIKLWDVSTRKEIATLSGHTHAVKSVAFHPQGQLLASGSWDKTIKIWDINSLQPICTLTGHKLQVTAVAFSPAGQLLASASFDRTVCISELPKQFSLESKPQRRYILEDHRWPVFCVAFSPDSKVLATGSNDNQIKLWDLDQGQVIRTLAGHSWSVVTLTYDTDGQTLFSGSWDKIVKRWRVSTGEELATLTGHLDSITAVAIDPRGKLIASGSKDKSIKLWGRQVES